MCKKDRDRLAGAIDVAAANLLALIGFLEDRGADDLARAVNENRNELHAAWDQLEKIR